MQNINITAEAQHCSHSGLSKVDLLYFRKIEFLSISRLSVSDVYNSAGGMTEEYHCPERRSGPLGWSLSRRRR